MLVESAGGGNRAASMGYCTMTKGWSKRRAVAGVTGILGEREREGKGEGREGERNRRKRERERE